MARALLFTSGMMNNTFSLTLQTLILASILAVGCGEDCPELGDPNVATERAFYKAQAPTRGGSFGLHTAIDGDHVVVVEDELHVYGRTDGGDWLMQTLLAPESADGTSVFTGGVDIDNGTIIASGFTESTPAVFVFSETDGTWNQTAVIEDPGDQTTAFSFDPFGGIVAIHDNTIVVGAPGFEFNVDGEPIGRAYVFARTDDAWSLQATLDPPTTGIAKSFGSTVAVYDDTIVVGDEERTDENGVEFGAAYVYTRSGDTWTLVQELEASDNPERFGDAVSIYEDSIVVSSRRNEGGIYVFEKQGETWTETAKLTASNADPGDGFGSIVKIDGDLIVVGAAGEDSITTSANGNQCNNHARDAGAAYAFLRTVDGWEQVAYIKASNARGDDRFGDNVAVQGNTIVVGAGGHSRTVDGEILEELRDSGAVYIYEFDRDAALNPQS